VAEVDSTLREVVLALENKIQALEKENKQLSKSQICIAGISIISWMSHFTDALWLQVFFSFDKFRNLIIFFL
jgi:hypothetical protein